MGVDKKVDNTKNPQQKQPSSPKEELSNETRHQQQTSVIITTSSSTSAFVSAPPLYVPVVVASQFEQQFDNPKRPRYATSTAQWKTLPSPSQQQPPPPLPLPVVQSHLSTTESTPSPNPQTSVAAASSSGTETSSPQHSPIPSLSAASGHQETSKIVGEGEQATTHHHHHHHQQFRKGKYVSPVWKPNEMLWLARAWRNQYQVDHHHHHHGGGGENSGGGGGGGSGGSQPQTTTTTTTRGKTRADKDREVAEFLNRHGINRDAKTAGTKWDNMLGEFRKVYEWERGGERDQVGKSYFRLSPYERKLHRLPASFDEEVFDELSQFMGSRIRSSSQPRSAGDDGSSRAGLNVVSTRGLPPPPIFKDDEYAPLSGRGKQLMLMSGGDPIFHVPTRGSGSLLGFDSSVEATSKELRRIGKVRMIWEESVSLWAEEGEHHHRGGRVKLEGSSFLNAQELTFFDESIVACTMESFENGPLKGFSVDRFIPGQQLKVFGRRKSSTSGFAERVQLPLTESSLRSMSQCELQDPTEYYVGCLRVPPSSLPNLSELIFYLQEPPSEELRFPLRKDVYRDLPQGKELFFTTTDQLVDCRAITYDILSAIIRTSPSISTPTASSRDSFIPLWDDCINRVVSKFCSVEMAIIRKASSSVVDTLQDQWPNVTGFIRNLCLWRGEETDQLREGQIEPSLILEKLLWTYMDLPYLLGYYAVGYLVTFCALSRSSTQDKIIRTDLYTADLSSPSERLKALVPCYRVAGLLTLLADRCFSQINNNNGGYKQIPFSDFERFHMSNGNVTEMTPNTVTRYFSSKRKFVAVKEIYDYLDHRIPHAEFITKSSEKDLALVFKPRGIRFKPTNCDQLVESLKYVTKALVALHDLSFMHRDLGWDKVMRRNDRENEWFVCGFEEAVVAPQIYPHGASGPEARGRHAPEMLRGLHGTKVDVWGVGYLIKTCGFSGVPKMLRDLQNRCLDQNSENRPTAADCYHHLLQLQSATAGSGSY
ncbi:hypothetical protein ACFE04_028770 [Oxalis oulophora]